MLQKLSDQGCANWQHCSARQLRPYKGALNGGVVLCGGGSVLKGFSAISSRSAARSFAFCGQLASHRPANVDLRIHSNELSTHYFQDPATKYISMISLLYGIRVVWISSTAICKRIPTVFSSIILLTGLRSCNNQHPDKVDFKPITSL